MSKLSITGEGIGVGAGVGVGDGVGVGVGIGVGDGVGANVGGGVGVGVAAIVGTGVAVDSDCSVLVQDVPNRIHAAMRVRASSLFTGFISLDCRPMAVRVGARCTVPLGLCLTW